MDDIPRSKSDWTKLQCDCCGLTHGNRGRPKNIRQRSIHGVERRICESCRWNIYGKRISFDEYKNNYRRRIAGFEAQNGICEVCDRTDLAIKRRSLLFGKIVVVCCTPCMDFFYNNRELDYTEICIRRRRQYRRPKRWANSRFLPIKKMERVKVREAGKLIDKKRICRGCGLNKRILNAKYDLCPSCVKKEQFFGELCNGCGKQSSGELHFESMTGEHMPSEGIFCNNCYAIINRYKISIDEYHQLIGTNNCEICEIELSSGGREGNSLCIDHDHETGTIRGVLCMNCNTIEGYLRKVTNDSPTWLENLRNYLITPSSITTNSMNKDGGTGYASRESSFPEKWSSTEYSPIPFKERFKFKEHGILLERKKLTCRKCGEKRILKSAKYHLCTTCVDKECHIGESCDACGTLSEGETRFKIMKASHLSAKGIFCYRCYKIIYDYGVNIDELKRIIQTENCEVCGVVLVSGKVGSHARAIDHDHESGVVRGILCTSCNKAEGYIRKSRLVPEVLIERIQHYIIRDNSS